MNDLTIIYLTTNRMPPKWVEFHKHHLLKAAGDFPIISISKEPIDIGLNILETEPPDYKNIYRQLLKGAKLASTPFVAMAEDDVLYQKEHYTEFRPKDNEVAYDRSRWSLFSWDSTMYSLRNRVSNCSLIAPREYLIEALEERFATSNPVRSEVWGEVGRHQIERSMGVTPRKMVEFWSHGPIVQLSHIDGTEERQQRGRKRHAQVRAFDIPYWGKPAEILRHYV